MARYIDADKLIDALNKTEVDEFEERLVIYKAVDMLYRALAAETADVAEVKHGKWNEQLLRKDEYGDKHVGYICSVCNEFVPHKGNYCLNCGAKMDGDRG